MEYRLNLKLLSLSSEREGSFEHTTHQGKAGDVVEVLMVPTKNSRVFNEVTLWLKSKTVLASTVPLRCSMLGGN